MNSWDYFFQPTNSPLIANNDEELMSTEELSPPLPPLVSKNEHASTSTSQARNLEEGAIDSVPSSLLEVIAPIFRAANEVEPINSRVAYLCRFHAFQKAHELDPTSTGLGVRQFKTALLHRLERDDEPSLSVRENKSDDHDTQGRSFAADDMQSFYRYYTTKYVRSLLKSTDKLDIEQVTKINQTASVLFEVLKASSLYESRQCNQGCNPSSNQTHSEEVYSPIFNFNVEELFVSDFEEKKSPTDEEMLPISPHFSPKISLWDYFFPDEEFV